MSDAELSPLKRAIIEIRELKAKVAASERRATEPIAIVGMGLRFPGGASDPESYWRLLLDGVDAIEEVPPERWSIDDLYDPDPDVPGRMATRYGGFLPDVDQFDAGFFGISPREAEVMDPQQRLLLEVVWESLEDAGIPADGLAGSRTAVFIGLTNTDYFRMVLADLDQIDTFTTTGNTPSVAAGRVSYLLGLEGPSVAIDTACSSSLVAVHLAVQSLRSGESDLALAGGVSLILAPELTINFSRAHMMAADGRCKTFDAAADGYVRSEGCGVVVLKRLSDALAAGDRVLAVVRGSAVNQDGRSGGLTAPNGPSQERVVRDALANAGIEPTSVGYVEAHGTGTPLGDPIEVHALGEVLCRGRDPAHPLLLGSVKTNVGHLEGAAGIAGLLKLVLMLQRGIVPPHLHLEELSPYIAAETLPIAVPTEPTTWPRPPTGRVAGVSSFGISGTNAHVVVAEAPPAVSDAEPADASGLSVLTISARGSAGLAELAARFADHLVAHPDQALADVAAAANTGRAHLPDRLAVLADDGATAARRLASFAAGEPAPGLISGRAVAATADIAFIFTGHGSHYAGMGAQLYARRPVFRESIDRCAALLGDQLDRPLTEILFGSGDALDQMRYAQPALFAYQYALSELWASWGVRPSVVAGHSAGEYVAAVLAGTMSLADGLRLVAVRGRLMQSLPEGGEMVAVFLPEADVAGAIARWPDDVGVAAVNGPTTTVISGRRHAVTAVLTELALDAEDFRRLDVSVAAHSPLVEPILDEFETVAGGIELRPPRLGLVSGVTGATGADLTDAGYWRRHLREPVRFAAVFETLRAAGYSMFVEVGPGSTLLRLGQRCWPDDTAVWAPSAESGRDEDELVLAGLATLHVHGAAVDWHAVAGLGARSRLALPTYPWQRQRYWAPAAAVAGPSTPSALWPAVVAAAETQAEQVPVDLDLGRYADGWSLLDRVAVAAVVAALRTRGLFASAGEQHDVGQLIAAGHFLPTYARLATRWLDHLVGDGLLRHTTDGGYVADAPLPAPPVADLVAAATRCFTGSEELVAYVERCARSLAAVVSGDEPALATLFPDGSYDTVDFLYHGWAATRYSNAIVRAAVAAAAQQRPSEVLRVLEVGAGTGGTTAAVLPALPADRTSYTFTDVSEFFLTRAAERFAAHRFVRYALLDLERDPAEQGAASGSYDVVIAANVLHATTDLDRTLTCVRELLVPGGVLIAYEAFEHFRWYDVTTGLIEGWQRFADDWRSDNPLLSPETWVEALGANGFTEVTTYPHADRPPAVLGQGIIVARAAGDPVRTARPLAEEHGVDDDATVRGAAVDVPDHAELAAALADALPDERVDVLIDLTRRAIARVLRITDPARLARDQPLLELGFDSLMAVELRDVLRRSLGLSRRLPATLVFDHPTIAAVAAYLDGLLGRGSDAEADHAASAPAEPAEPPIGASTLAEMSDDEVAEMLLAKLVDVEEGR